ncbi:hypothetical protein GCM10009551_023680 [Nocardiopsis tropica]
MTEANSALWRIRFLGDSIRAPPVSGLLPTKKGPAGEKAGPVPENLGLSVA